MKSIKTYFLLVLLLILFNGQVFSQDDFYNDKKEQKNEIETLSKEDSILVNAYYTEKDYNILHGIETGKNYKKYTADEVYNEESHRRKRRHTDFWESFAAEVLVEVIFESILLVTLFWQ